MYHVLQYASARHEGGVIKFCVLERYMLEKYCLESGEIVIRKSHHEGRTSLPVLKIGRHVGEEHWLSSEICV